MLKEKNSIFRKIQLFFDVALTVLSFFAAYLVKTMDLPLVKPADHLIHYMPLLYMILPVWPLLLYLTGGYESIRVKSLGRAVLPALKAVVWGGAVLMVMTFLAKYDTSRSLVIIFLFLNALFLSLARAATYYFFHSIRRRGLNYRSVLVVGTGERARNFIHTIRDHAEWGLTAVGFVDVDPASVGKRMMGLDVLGTIDEIPDLLTTRQVDEIVCVGPKSWHGHIEKIVQQCEDIGVTVRIACDFYKVKHSRVDFESLGQWPLLTISPPPHYGELYVIKRACDIVVSLVLLVLTSPLLVLISLAIKLTSRGPVFFKQIRCGMNGRKFNLLKFRTMVTGADRLKEKLSHVNEMSGPVFKASNDPRITPVGRFLRKYSLDEFPQFINVLKGDMSIVGPRPPVPSEVGQYEYGQRRRLSVNPGITCLWQVNGRNKVGFSDWVKLDLEYIDRWSLWLDLKIILKTIPAVLRGTGL